MSEHYNGFLVVLKDSVCEEESDALAKAIGVMRGVISVEPIADEFGDSIARAQAKYEMREKIFALLWPPKGGK